MVVSALKNLAKVSFVVVTVLLGLLVVKITIYNDVTTSPAYDYSHHRTEPVYLLSYADGREIFYKNQSALALSAINRGFDGVFNYKRDMLSEEFVAENKEILDLKFGVGYWLWKPWVILDAMERAPKNAILVYSDVGFVFTDNIENILSKLDGKDGILMEYDQVDLFGTLEEAINRQTLVRNNCDTPECRQSPHMMAGFVVVRNNEGAKRFITSWLELCKNIENLTGQTDIDMEQHPTFALHRHDEALLSLNYFLEENNMYLFPASQATNLYWAHRKKEEDTFKTLYPYIYRHKALGFDRKVTNYPMFRWLRKQFS